MTEALNADLVEQLKKDLAFQLTFDPFDWDHFIETAKLAQKTAAGEPVENPPVPEAPERDFESALEGFRIVAEANILDHYARNSYTFAVPSIVIPSRKGKKYVKLCNAETRDDGHIGSRGVFAFVEIATGDILKPASFRAPAKHARGNIFDEDKGFSALTVAGGIRYLK